MNTAAALAAGSIAFRDVDHGYASLLLERAKMLYDFGERCPGDYIVDGASIVLPEWAEDMCTFGWRGAIAPSIAHGCLIVDEPQTTTTGTIPATANYNDGGRYLDEQAFAAAWLHKATGGWDGIVEWIMSSHN